MLKTIVSCKSFECLAVVVGPIIGSYYLWDSLFTEDLFHDFDYCCFDLLVSA